MNGLSNYITEMLCKEVKHEPVIYDGCNSLLGRDKRNSILSDWRIAGNRIEGRGSGQDLGSTYPLRYTLVKTWGYSGCYRNILSPN